MKRKLTAFAVASIFLAAASASTAFAIQKTKSEPLFAEKTAGEKPSERFGFTRAQWESTLVELPAFIRNAIHSDEELFFKEMEEILDTHPSFFVHIDAQTPVEPIDCRPADLVDLSGYSVEINKPMQLRKAAAEAFAALSQAAAADGIRIVGISGYRTYAYQQRLYENLKNAVGKAGKAVSAAPGHSQHQTGLAMDFNSLEQDFDETPEGLWLKAHAADFGWSLSYPEEFETLTGYDYEPWHFRYLTAAACRLQKRFFADIQFYLTRYLHDWYGFYKEFRINE